MLLVIFKATTEGIQVNYHEGNSEEEYEAGMSSLCTRIQISLVLGIAHVQMFDYVIYVLFLLGYFYHQLINKKSGL